MSENSSSGSDSSSGSGSSDGGTSYDGGGYGDSGHGDRSGGQQYDNRFDKQYDQQDGRSNQGYDAQPYPPGYQQPYPQGNQQGYQPGYGYGPTQPYGQGGRSLEGEKAAQLSLILGIVGLFFAGLILGPLAIWQAGKAEKLGVPATAGKVLGWISAILWLLGLVSGVAIFVIALAGMSAAGTYGG